MWNNQISLPFLQHHSVCIVHFSTNIVILFASCLDNTYPVQITVGGIEFTPETVLCGVNTVVKQGSTVSLWLKWCHYCDIIMGMMASQITSFTIVYSTVYSGIDQRKHQSSASLAFVRGIHQWPVNSLHKGPVTWKMFPFDDVIMLCVWNDVHFAMLWKNYIYSWLIMEMKWRWSLLMLWCNPAISCLVKITLLIIHIEAEIKVLTFRRQHF